MIVESWFMVIERMCGWSLDRHYMYMVNQEVTRSYLVDKFMLRCAAPSRRPDSSDEFYARVAASK